MKSSTALMCAAIVRGQNCSSRCASIRLLTARALQFPVPLSTSGTVMLQGSIQIYHRREPLGRPSCAAIRQSDSNGVVNFTTIYPGWYTGRAVHIHFKIRDALTTNPAQYHFISQFFFNEELTTQVHAQSPYASKGTRDVEQHRQHL